MNGHQNESQSRLTISTIRSHLESCGYRAALLRANVPPFISKNTLVAFAHQPFDARSACIAVVEVEGESKDCVAELRSLAAPVVFALRPEGLEWWQQGISPRRIGPVIPPSDVPSFFDRHEPDFAPDAIYRAKTWGRFDQHYQRTFVDLGLMPLVETQIGEQLQSLISSNVQSLKSLLKWENLSVEKGAWLLKSVFWLVSAKILKDKAVAGFKTADLQDVEKVLDSVGEHFGAERISISSKKQREGLSEIAENIAKCSSLELVTTESLAHVYENTLISKATRQALGTHSTPSYLVDYIVGRLTPWIQEIELSKRNVFEPACGHAAFLVSAMRLLTELHPDGVNAPKRRNYLRQRIHGCEIDAFALEIARLSLSLTDIPNPNGWDLHIGDMFVGNTLETMASKATIMLANPPFENFKESERTWYSKQNAELLHVNKTAEMLRRVLPALPQGAVIGIVVPQGFLHSKNATNVRNLLVTDFELQEICLFPDKVFEFADSESAVITARKCDNSHTRVRYRRVRERGMDIFKLGYVATAESDVDPGMFQSRSADLRIPELSELWKYCASKFQTVLEDHAEIGKGLEYKSLALPKGGKTYSDKPFANAVRGFVRFESNIQLHQLPMERWLSLDPAVIQAERHGTSIGTPQVVFNYARVSRGPWRLKGLLDPQGHAVTTRFVVIRPANNLDFPIRLFWALMNSPIANAFAFATCGNRDNLTGQLGKLPFPANQSSRVSSVVAAASRYLDFVAQDPEAVLQKPINLEKARALMLRVDAAVLQLYDLPRDLERQLLDYFAGWQREGVPFKFDRYFPEHFTDPISLADYLAITEDWTKTNHRRAELIHKKVGRTITPDERTELNHLQSLASSRKNLIAPLPIAELERLHREVVGEAE